MHLEGVKFDGDWILETLISRCSVLGELTIVTHHGDYLGIVCVRSLSLKSFKLVSTRGEECEDERLDDPDVEIDAPRLAYMSISNYQSESFKIHNIGPSAKVNIDVMFDVENNENEDPSERTMMRNFLTGISTVREMKIYARTLEMIDDYLELEPLPQFAYLIHLHVSFLESPWEKLPTFLGFCPNLHSLNLEFECPPETEEINLPYVPQCFLSSLQFVQLTAPVIVKRTSNEKKLASEKKLAIYFLRNCVILKKLVLSESFKNIIKKIEGIPERSIKCRVVILKPPYENVSPKSSLLPLMF